MSNENKEKLDKATEGFENKLIPRLALSHILPDGRMAEMVWIPEQEMSGFAVGGADKYEFRPELFLDSDGGLVDDPQKAVKLLVPLPAHKGLVQSNLIKFASGVEPYESPKALYEEVRSFIKQYMVLDEDFYTISALYVMMTWVYERFHALPYLRVIGNYGTGKSRFIEIVGNLSNRAIMAGASITPAALYRTVDMIRGTLAYDEADLRFSDMSADIVKVLNGGHRKGMPVLRMDGEGINMQPKAFEVYGPKILGSREPFSDLALESRCLTQRLFPMKKVDVPVHIPESFDEDTTKLRNKLLAFRFGHYQNIHDDEPSLGDVAFPRLKQSALAITSLAKYIDQDMVPPLLEFLMRYEEQLRRAESTDILADILLCIIRIVEFDPRYSRQDGRIYMRTISEAFNERFYDDYKDRQTREVNSKEGPLVIKGQEVSARRVGTLVDKLGLEKERGSEGVFINAERNAHKLSVLADRFGLTHIIEEEKVAYANRPKIPRTSYQPTTPVEGGQKTVSNVNER